MARRVGLYTLKHPAYHEQTRLEFDWANFVTREELIRLLLGIFLLDVYFINFNGVSYQMVFPELTMQLALHEACFQATSADECYGNLHFLLESKSLLWNTTAFACFPPRKPLMRCNVKVPNEEGLVPLVGTFTDLQRRRLILNVPAVSDVFQNALICPDKDVQEQLARYNKVGTDHVLDDWRVRWCLGSWQVNFACYGPPAVVDAVFRVIESEFYKVRGAVLTQSKYVAKPGQILNPDETGEEPLPQNGVLGVEGIAAVNMREDGGGHAASSLIRPYLYE